jgi:hypothetical protein
MLMKSLTTMRRDDTVLIKLPSLPHLPDFWLDLLPAHTECEKELRDDNHHASSRR